MERARSISKSMMSYLKRAREHKEFLLKETTEFERGKRHLANMMGIEAKEMTQSDVDEAIKYLFPSGLFEKRARPIMKHPDLIFKAQKEAQFDIDGRPHHYLFYTVTPNYYEAIGEINKLLRELNQIEDSNLAEGILIPPTDSSYSMSGRTWCSHEKLQEFLLEKIPTADYEYFIRCLDHLVKHPYSVKAKSFIDKYSVLLSDQTLNLQLPELKRDESTGSIYTELTTRAREHRVHTKTVLNGTGQIDIDGKDILYFDTPYIRAGLLFPLRLSGMQDKVDIFSTVVYKPTKVGQKSIAVAIREAVSLSIAAYVDEDTRERMRLAGLLTHDYRLRERKKFGQAKARRKYTWKKR